MNNILLIDGNSLTYRAFYGSAYGPSGILKNSKGIPTNAVLTLNRMINNAIKTYKPTHIFVAFDAAKRTKRHDKLESYKGKRSATPQELIIQFPLVKEMLTKLNICWHQIPGIEADDIIATLTKKFSKDNNIMILSSDKDMYQLVDKNVKIIMPQNGQKQDKIVAFEEFYIRQGYHPYQVADMKGIVGDSSDNLPGVKGIGEKGAIKLIEKYKNLETIYENIDEQTGAVKEKLIQSKDIAFLSKELAILDCNVEVPYDINKIVYNEYPSEEIISFFEELEISSLVKKYFQKLEEKKEEKNNQISFDNLVF